ncbi:hypothetical protein GCM10007079_51080 [Nocardiopsis terrae]|nr:hypothetical protein GCM10007079_51080 [Nocardiopsis terrae]
MVQPGPSVPQRGRAFGGSGHDASVREERRFSCPAPETPGGDVGFAPGPGGKWNNRATGFTGSEIGVAPGSCPSQDCENDGIVFVRLPEVSGGF